MLVRYTDDSVILCRGNADRILKRVKLVLEDLGLTLNEEKTRVVDARREWTICALKPSLSSRPHLSKTI